MTEIYGKLRKAPDWALRPIAAGRLKGYTDINPQWRYEEMDKQFGLCGIGWKYELTNFQTMPGGNSEIVAFAYINLYVKQDDKWSDPIPGFGGSMLVEKEKAGLHTNDEALKMAVTDALSVATKMLGMAADVYAGRWDGSKYNEVKPAANANPQPEANPISLEQRVENIKKLISEATLESLNGENYKKKFNAFCKEAGPEIAEQLVQLQNNRFLQLQEELARAC